MRTKEFMQRLEHERIVQSIREAESRTSAELRVYIQRGNVAIDPLAAATRKFEQLGMHRTQERNAVLIYVAPRAHKFAVVGDAGIHERCGPNYWHEIVARMGEHFRSERFSQGIVDAVREVGDALTRHFPATVENPNELPDSIVED
jgi:uncharacterized membrane protein